MIINEIFHSIQGEGKNIGLPTVFIRTTGCNLRCSFCDTKYAYDEGEEKTIEEIKKEIQKYKCKNVCITGGEPLIQKETLNLINELSKEGYFLTIETNGSIDIKPLTKNEKITISLDIKCPSSKMDKEMILENITNLQYKDQLKFIINEEEDYKYASKTIKQYDIACTIFFQPVWGTDIKKLAEQILKDKLDVRLGLQAHKIIWGEVRGK